MDKLRPVEDVWDELSEPEATDEDVLGIIQADRDETVLLCVEAAVTAITEYCKGTVSYEPIREAIYAVAKPPETERERLGRKLWESWPKFAVTHWGEVLEDVKESYRKGAAVVQAELAKIQEEQKL